MAEYTAPSGNNVDLKLKEYTSPSGDSVGISLQPTVNNFETEFEIGMEETTLVNTEIDIGYTNDSFSEVDYEIGYQTVRVIDTEIDIGFSNLYDFNTEYKIGFTKIVARETELSIGLTQIISNICDYAFGVTLNYFEEMQIQAGLSRAPTFNKKKQIDVANVTDTPTISKTQPFIITSGDDSTTGTGDIVLDWTNISSKADIAVYDENGNLLDYYFESFDATAETAIIWVYRDWVRNGSTQAQIAYGNGPSDQSVIASTVFDKDTDLVSGWLLNETSGDALDVTSNNNDGTLNGGVTQGVTGQVDGAYDFDGEDDYINVGNDSSLDIGDSGALGFWGKLPVWNVNEESGGISDNITYPDDNTLYLSIHDSVGLHFRYGGTNQDDKYLNYQSSDSWADNSWHYMIATWYNSGGTTYLKLYADGVEVASGTTSLSISFPTPPTWIIGYSFVNSVKKYFNGPMDDVRIHNSALSSTTIQAQYDATKDSQDFFSQQAGEIAAPTFKLSINCGKTDSYNFVIDYNIGCQAINDYPLNVEVLVPGVWDYSLNVETGSEKTKDFESEIKAGIVKSNNYPIDIEAGSINITNHISDVNIGFNTDYNDVITVQIGEIKTLNCSTNLMIGRMRIKDFPLDINPIVTIINDFGLNNEIGYNRQNNFSLDYDIGFTNIVDEVSLFEFGFITTDVYDITAEIGLTQSINENVDYSIGKINSLLYQLAVEIGMPFTDSYNLQNEIGLLHSLNNESNFSIGKIAVIGYSLEVVVKYQRESLYDLLAEIGFKSSLDRIPKGNDVNIELLDYSIPTGNNVGLELIRYYDAWQFPLSDITIGIHGTPEFEIDYEIGLKDVVIQESLLIEVGMPCDIQNFPLDITIEHYYDTPVFIVGKFGKALRLGNYSLTFDVGLTGDYTIRLFRRAVDENNFNEIVVKSDGSQHINGVLDGSYDTSWLSVNPTTGVITITKEAWDIDELMIIPAIISEEEISFWNEKDRYFYSDENILPILKPSNVNMEVS